MFHHGLYGFGGLNGISAAWPWMLAASIFKIIIVGLIVFFIVRLLINNKKAKGYGMNNQAIEILQHRYAKGEISEEEYIERMKVLEK